MKIEIKSWFNESVLFAHECENNTIKITLEAAVKLGAKLNGARLNYADLSYAKFGATLPIEIVRVAAKLHGLT